MFDRRDPLDLEGFEESGAEMTDAPTICDHLSVTASGGAAHRRRLFGMGGTEVTSTRPIRGKYRLM